MLITCIGGRSDPQLLLSVRHCKYYCKEWYRSTGQFQKLHAGLTNSAEVSLNRN